jgi:hypothetical protein
MYVLIFPFRQDLKFLPQNELSSNENEIEENSNIRDLVLANMNKQKTKSFENDDDVNKLNFVEFLLTYKEEKKNNINKKNENFEIEKNEKNMFFKKLNKIIINVYKIQIIFIQIISFFIILYFILYMFRYMDIKLPENIQNISDIYLNIFENILIR